MNARGRLHQALKELLESNPIDQITVIDLVERADISRQTFYRLYPDKFALLKDFYHVSFVPPFQSADTLAKINVATYDLITRFIANKHVVKNMFFSKDGYALKSFFRDLCVETDTEFWRSQGVDVEDERIAGAIRLYAYGTTSFLLEWIKGGMKGDPQLVADQFALATPACLVAPTNEEFLQTLL